MRFLNVFRLPRHSKFTYIPQYYDPDKEDLKERLRQIELEKQDSAEGMKHRITKGLRYGEQDRSYRKKTIVRSNMTILIVFAVLIVLTVLFINYYLPTLVN